MVFGFRKLPEAPSFSDISPKAARIGFWLAIALGIFFMYYHGIQPIGAYWDDQAMEICDPRFTLDMFDFRNSFIFPTGCREPFYSYLNIGLWTIFPSATALFIQRLSGVLIYLGLIWVLYLLGKEVMNRRMGVMLALMGAFCKPVIMKSLIGMRISGLMLGVAVALLFIFRVVKKPDFSHFLQWAVGISFGLFTYATYRPFVPFFVLGTLVLFLIHKRERKAGSDEKLLAWVTAGIFLLYIFYSNNVFAKDNLISWLMDFNGALFPSILALIYFLTLVWFLRHSSNQAKSDVWFGWVAGTSLLVLITFPVMTDSTILGRMRDSQLESGTVTFAELIRQIAFKLKQTFNILFISGEDRTDLSILVDSYFGYVEVIFISLGLALLAARPNRRMVFVFLASLVGVVGYVLTRGPHTGRLAGCTVPFIVLGVWGGLRLFDSMLQVFQWKKAPKMLFLLMILFGVWIFRTDVVCVYDRWFDFYVSKHCLAYHESLKDLEQGKRVYLGKTLDGRSAAVLYEGHTVMSWTNNPVLYLKPNEKVPDVVVYSEPDYGVLNDYLKGAFPTAIWRNLKDPDHMKNGPAIALSCTIPSDVVSGSGKFEIKRMEPSQWKREFYDGEYGFGFGVLKCEDLTADIKATPCGGEHLPGSAVRYTGTIRVARKASYEIEVKTDNRTIVSFDGKVRFDIRYPRTNNFFAHEKLEERKFKLSEGEHLVQVTTYYQRADQVPEITWKMDERGNHSEHSLWQSFDWKE
jgi:hypothetical protein